MEEGKKECSKVSFFGILKNSFFFLFFFFCQTTILVLKE